LRFERRTPLIVDKNTFEVELFFENGALLLDCSRWVSFHNDEEDN
jgi:hypothetical protein